MKKILSAIISSPLKGRLGGVLFAILTTTSLWAQSFQVGDLHYNITSSSEPYTVEVSDAISSITTATIPETVTYNGITYSVTSIGRAAFDYCLKLTSITIPNSVTSIEKEAFHYCSSLTSVTIGNSVTNIGNSAFSDCSSLTSITIPNSVTNIGKEAFDGTGIYNDESNWENEVLYIDNYLIEAKASISGLYTIKENTRLIVDYAFYHCKSLTSITIPNSVTSIGTYAFQYCSSLSSVTIGNSVTSIGNGAFSGCESLTSITIPNSVTSIGWSAFNGCSALTSITIPNSVTSIEESAFKGCSSLTSVTIPNSVTSIESYAFEDCSSLTITNYTGDVASWCNIKFGYEANPIHYSHNFYINGEEITELVIPNSVTSIGNYAFEGCSSITAITIPNSVTSIGEKAFYGSAFPTLIKIEAITPPSIGSRVFYSGGITPIYIPENTLSAYQQAWGNEYTFINNENTLNLHVEVPGTLSDLIFDAGMRPANIVKLALTGTLNDDDFTCMRETMALLVDVNLSEITNTSGVNFNGKSRLITVILPNNLTSIDKNAFSGCSSLASITIPNSVTSIGNSAFCECNRLSSITFPNNVTSIGEKTFSQCSSLTSVTISNSVTSIGKNAFEYCSSLASITIPNSITSIGEKAFSYCSHLISITCLGITPPDASNLGANTSTCQLIVPQSAYNAYLRHAYWGQFLNILPAYQVTLQANNVQWGEVDGAGLYTQEATITATPYEGYTFTKWSDGNTENPRTLQLTSDTTLTAEFDVDTRLLVTFVDWDGTVLSSIKVTSGDAATAPADPTREGYTFIGWDKDFSVVTDHMTITAQYQINRYRVRFFDFNDTLLHTDSVEYQATAVAPADPYRTGYTFTGWDKAFDSITADLDVYAQYEMGEDYDMTIVFTNREDNDSEIYSQSLTIKIPAAPLIEGFTFLKWRIVEGDLTDVIAIQAIYEANTPTSAEVYTNPANPAQKLLRNGQVYILQDGKTYTITGQKL